MSFCKKISIMEKKLSGVVLLLLLLLTHELVVRIEARTCHSRSRHFHGGCYFRNQIRNCKTICREEKFTAGQCFRGTCYCSTKCGSQGGGHDHPHPHPPPSPPDHGGDGGDDGGSGGDGGGAGGETPPISQSLMPRSESMVQNGSDN